ncbi:bifunctional diaminohydroxyphosphoribosylaminopyrimidine deaminase/5-amino-6-(5-phosphoribosylamino)uracil reductase RibD [Anatilimnocola sp. NA78]|uniref:bifunctional diaminohydroxyphosphoribosylaminopyrimidine deaminase/5-amino-6-(5-phosphoribosylamino)uracil reductase RibD n=1 Tax=Anatilimnocola sp. NA78 TaxID=3415683 RepID=UPI003CE52DA1
MTQKSSAEMDQRFMRRALELAARGQGSVEPNPMVGCVIVRAGQIVGEDYHQRYGGPHAEIEALRAAGEAAKGSTLYVTLEPCCHFGKTPPCSQAVIAAGVSRVVAAMRDPFPQVSGQGVAELQAAGVQIELGLLEQEARELNAPYLMLVGNRRPWIIAKWAMTLDGKIATRTGRSKWISGPESREVVQQLRSRVDAVLIGRRTAELDDPLLTARLATGQKPARVATRIVLDSQASLSLHSQLVKTAREVPLLVVTSEQAEATKVAALQAAGAEVLSIAASSAAERLRELFKELGKRRLTNVLCEGGGQLLGSLFDDQLVDEVHCFIAPKIFGSAQAAGPVAGQGIELPDLAADLDAPVWQQMGSDLYVRGQLRKRAE